MRRLLLTGISILVCSLAATAQTAPQAPASGSTPTAAAPTQAAPAAAQGIDPVKEADIHRLFEVMNLKQMQDQVIATMMTAMGRELRANLPEDEKSQELMNLLMVKLRQKFKQADFLSPLIPLYDKYYTDDDIKGLIAFYGTPLGQRFLQAAPQITQESLTAGMQLGRQLGEESVREVMQEHRELAPSMQPNANPPQN
jgi:hypothetical protein